MNATEITFNVKDVVGIVVITISIVSFILALKWANKRNQDRLEAVVLELEKHKRETAEKFLHTRTSKKAAIEMIRQEIKERDQQLNKRMDEMRDENRQAYRDLTSKIGTVGENVASMNNSLSELTGYLRGKGQIDPPPEK